MTLSCKTVVKRSAEEIPSQTRRAGIRERVLLSREDCPHQNIVLIDIDQGAEVELHPFPTSESYFVLEGTIEIFFPGSAEVLRKGDLCHLPPKEVHGLRSRDGPAQVLLIFAPPFGRESQEVPSRR